MGFHETAHRRRQRQHVRLPLIPIPQASFLFLLSFFPTFQFPLSTSPFHITIPSTNPQGDPHGRHDANLLLGLSQRR